MATKAEAGLFEPADDISEAGKILGLMEDTAVGNVMSYEDIDRVLDRDFFDNRTPYYVALRRFHKQHPGKGTFKVIPNVGYERIDDYTSTMIEAERHRKKSRRQLIKSKERVLSPDKAKMTPAEIREASNYATRIGVLEGAVRDLQKGYTVLQKDKADAADVDELRAELEALKARVDGQQKPPSRKVPPPAKRRRTT